MALGKTVSFHLLAGLLIASNLYSEEPVSEELDSLHQKIDQAVVDTSLFGQTGKRCSDYEFVRRVYLDLIGRSPNAEELNAFLQSESNGRRSDLINQLLSSSEFVDYFATALDVILMERRGGKRIAQSDWIAFLENSLREGWTYDRIVQTIIAADGRGDSRAAAKFFLDREVESNALTRDVSRIFLGRDLQCAQCHDHPNIDDYFQSEYYQLHAFLTRSYLFEDPADKKKPYIGEKAEGESEYQSVFTEDPLERATPSLLGNLTLDVEPRYHGETAYAVSPSKNAAAQPKFSRRVELARLLTSPNNDQFARNTANRLWAHMMGRGLVHPVDFDHSANPPSNPKLLQVLADGLRSQQFSIRGFLSEVARSGVYQGSIEVPEQPPANIAELESAVTTAEQALAQAKSDRVAITEFLKPFEQRLDNRRTQLANLDNEITEKDAQRKERLKKITELEKKGAELKKNLTNSEQKLASESKKEPKESPALAKLKSAVETAKKSVQDNTLAVTNEKKASEALLQQMTVLKSRRIGVADGVAEARGALMAARRLKSNGPSISDHRQHISFLKQAEELVSKKQDLTQLNAQLVRDQKAMTVEIGKRDQLKSNHAKSVEKESSVKTKLAQAVQAVAGKRKDLADRRKTLDDLANALKQSEHLAKSLADDALLQLVQSTAKRRKNLQDALSEFESQIAQLQSQSEQTRRELDKSTAERIAADSAVQTADRAIQLRESQIAKLKEQHRNAEVGLKIKGDEWIDTQERRLIMRRLKPLSPEQLAGAMISALRLDRSYRILAESDWKKKNKDVALDPANKKQQSEINAFLDKRIEQVRKTFVTLYAAPAGAPQDVFSSTADQALFLSNDGQVQSWLSAAEGTLVKKLVETESSDQVAQTMYRSILCRPPNDDEIKASNVHLASRNDDRTKAIQEMVWGLVSSIEFRFNH